MSALISMTELYRKLKEKSLSTINTMNENKNNNNNSDNVKHNEVFEHNLRVLIELCDQKLNINDSTNNNNNNNKSDDNEDDYESNVNEVNVKNEKFIVKVKSNDKNGYKYQCVFNAVCNKQFTHKQNCLDHINTHTGRQPYKCDHNSNCTFKTAHKHTLYQHKHNVHSFKKFVCNWSGCGYMSSAKQDFTRHKRIHTGEKPYKCDWSGCNYRCINSDAVTRHKRTHTGEKPYKCDWNGCDFRTATHSNLTRHKLTHTGESLFECHHRSCEFKTAYKSNLSTHLKNVHSMNSRFNLKKKLYAKNSVNRMKSTPMRATYSLEERCFKCDWNGCDYYTINHSHMTEHTRTHTGEKPFK